MNDLQAFLSISFIYLAGAAFLKATGRKA